MEQSHRTELRHSIDAFRKRARWLVGSSIIVLGIILALIGYSGIIVRGVITTSESTLSAGASEELQIQREQLTLLENVVKAYRQQFEIGQRSVGEYLYQVNRLYATRERVIEIEAQMAAAKSGVAATIDGRPYTAEHLRSAYLNSARHLQELEGVVAAMDARMKAGIARTVDKFDTDIARNEAAVRVKRYEAAVLRVGLELPVVPAPASAPTAAPARRASPASAAASTASAAVAASAEAVKVPPEVEASLSSAGGGVMVAAGLSGGSTTPHDARSARVGPGIVKTPGADEGNLRLVLYYITQFSGVLVLLLTISILLPIYRYNVKLATFYQARADALGIFLITGREDFQELVRALTPNYSFDKSANTPVGALADMVKDAAAVLKK